MNKKIKDLVKKKNISKIVCLTAYSKKIASILDNHCDIVLVGDSLGSVLYSFKSTKEVTLETMINHSKSVRLGVKKSIMIVDMPYNTYRNSREALKNVKLVMKKTKCDGVKLEGGKKIIPIVKNLTKNIKIPTIGIGSSSNCDGQVLVIDDLIGMSDSKFKFVKKYVDLSKIINSAVKKYKNEVKNKQFPRAKHSFAN